jgi:hypothetical protein
MSAISAWSVPPPIVCEDFFAKVEAVRPHYAGFKQALQFVALRVACFKGHHHLPTDHGEQAGENPERFIAGMTGGASVRHHRANSMSSANSCALVVKRAWGRKTARA